MSDLTVPTFVPTTSATSSHDKDSKYRSAKIV